MSALRAAVARRGPAGERHSPFWYAAVGALCVLMLVPMYLLVVNAFKDQRDIVSRPFSLAPGQFTLEHLVAAWNNPDFDIAFGYAVTVGLVVCVNLVSIGVCAPAAYVIARSPRAVFRVALLFFVSGMFIPTQVILVPVIFVLRSLGLMSTFPGLVLFMASATVPFTVFVFTGFIRMLPASLDEAAAIDGAGPYRTLWTIILPLMKPIIATVFILNTLSVCWRGKFKEQNTKHEGISKTEVEMTERGSEKPYDLEERTFLFAKRVRAFVKILPRTVSSREDVPRTGAGVRVGRGELH